MKLLLRTKNYKYWGDIQVEFTEQITLLSAVSGKGKSSLLSAIYFNLTGQGIKSECIKKKCTKCSVVLIYTDDEDKTYKINRRLPKKVSFVDDYGHKFRNQEECQSKITTLFRNQYILANICFMEQENMNKTFAYTIASEKMALVGSLLDNEKMMQIKGKCKDALKQTMTRVDSTNNEISTLTTIRNTILKRISVSDDLEALQSELGIFFKTQYDRVSDRNRFL